MLCVLHFYLRGVMCHAYLRDRTRCLPHRFIGISFSVVARLSRVVNCKLLLCRETGCDSRTRAAALFLSELFYGSGTTLESSSFLQGKTWEMISDVKNISWSVSTELQPLCRAIVTAIRKLALYVQIYRVSISCIKCFQVNPAYVCPLSSVLQVLLSQHCIKRCNTVPVIFFCPSTRKKLFSALAANEVELKESYRKSASFLFVRQLIGFAGVSIFGLFRHPTPSFSLAAR